jgi:hypothetical protein
MLELSIYCITFKSNYRAVQVGVVKLYVANVKALRKKERQGELSYSQKLMNF